MKRSVFCSLLAALILFSCQDHEAEKQALQSKVDSLKAANAAQASQLKDISEFMAVVSEGLDSIAAQEEQLTGNGKGMENKKMTKEELKAHLDAFAALLERQRNRIAQLEDTLKSRGESFGNLKNIITHLNQQLDEKNQTIAALQASLNSKNVDIQQLRKKVTTLTASNEKLTEEVNKQGEAMRRHSPLQAFL